MPTIGWVLDSSPRGVMTWPWQPLSIVAELRYGLIGQYITKTYPDFQMRRYRPWTHYDAVLFLKMMNPACQRLAMHCKAQGTKVIFDTNVNYYETWGEFPVPGTFPTTEQQQQAIAMTTMADYVVADSTYLMGVCLRYNSQVSWVPDPVDTDFYSPRSSATQDDSSALRLIWSGVLKKAHHLELIEPVLERHKSHIQLTLVTDPQAAHNPKPPVVQRLEKKSYVRLLPYSATVFRDALRASDVIISPKILTNAYEAGHTEYKITTGMACGLPALASPQASYKEALADHKGGFICSTESEWDEHLTHWIKDRHAVRQAGLAARERVIERYSVPVVAKRYHAIFRKWF